MTMRSKNLVLRILHLLITTSSVGAGFVEPPSPINATLGSEAHFNCRVDVGIQLFWRINETISNAFGILPTVRTENQMLASSLRVPAVKVYNNSIVECAIYLRDENGSVSFLYSEPVYLHIQGPPSAVGNFQATLLSGAIHLSWLAPTTLDITNSIEPDLWYDIRIVNVTTRSNSTPIPCLECPVYELQYTFTVDRPDPCHIFEFEVIPENGAGQGQASGEPVTGYFLEKPLPISGADVKAETTLLPAGDLHVVLLFPVDNLCPGQTAESFQLYYVNSNRGTTVTHMPKFVMENGSAVIEIVVQLSSLPIYNISIESENQAGRTNSTGTIELYASNSIQVHIDDVKLETTNSTEVCITCYYTNGTDGKGCIVILHSTDNNIEPVRYNITKDSANALFSRDCFEVETEGNYTIEVYEWNISGREGNVPVYILQTTVTLPVSQEQPPSGRSSIQTSDSDCNLLCIGSTGGGGATLIILISVIVCIVVVGCWKTKAPKKNAAVKQLIQPSEEPTFPLRQNLCYEDSQALRVTRGPQPTDIEECPAYGVLNMQQ